MPGKVPSGLYKMSIGKDYRLREALDAAGMTEDDVDALTAAVESDGAGNMTGSSLAQWWVNELHNYRKATAPQPSLFTSSINQLRTFRRWNHDFALNFATPQRDSLGYVPKFTPDGPLQCQTLCWTLGTWTETLTVKLAILESVYGRGNIHYDPEFKTDIYHLLPTPGTRDFMHNRLWWQVIDAGSNKDKSPNQIPAYMAAGLEVFDFVMQNPKYVMSQNGRDKPYLGIPGLRVHVDSVSGPHVPNIFGGEGGFTIGVFPADSISSLCAESVLIE